MHLLVTRPEPDARELRARLEALGHRVTIEPLLRIELVPDAIDLKGAQALIATSRNGLKALAESAVLPEALKLPIFTVGPATATLARSLGFARVTSGPASARELAPVIAALADPSAGPLLHLAGDVLATDLGAALQTAGFAVRQEIVYRSVPAHELSATTVEALSRGDIDAVILLSPRTAEIYAELIARNGLEHAARRLAHYCLSANVAAGLASLAPDEVAIAVQPNSEEMLALIARKAAQSA